MKLAAEKKMKPLIKDPFQPSFTFRDSISPAVLRQTRQETGNSTLEVDDAFGKPVAHVHSPSDGNTSTDDCGEASTTTGEESDDQHLIQESGVEIAKGRSRKRQSSGPAPWRKKNRRCGSYVNEETETAAAEKENAISLVPSAGTGTTELPERSPPYGAEIEHLPIVLEPEWEACHSSWECKIASTITAALVRHIESQIETWAKTDRVLENAKAQVLKKEAQLLEEKVQLLGMERAGLVREEIRIEREKKRMEEEENRKHIMMRRKFVMEQADRLRQEARMYHKLNLPGKALACLEKMKPIMNTLESLGKEYAHAPLCTRSYR